MTWKLVIELLLVMSCQASDPACPPPRPPVMQDVATMASAEECERRAANYRRVLPATRQLVQTSKITVEQQTTIHCVSQDSPATPSQKMSR